MLINNYNFFSENVFLFFILAKVPLSKFPLLDLLHYILILFY